jgi:hypothetical protein
MSDRSRRAPCDGSTDVGYVLDGTSKISLIVSDPKLILSAARNIFYVRLGYFCCAIAKDLNIFVLADRFLRL